MTASFSLHVQDDFQWHLSGHGQQLRTIACPLIEQLPSTLKSLASIEEVLTLVNGAKVCQGNPDEKFWSLSIARKRCFMDATGLLIFICLFEVLFMCYQIYPIGIHVSAVEEVTLSGHPTIHHKRCEILINSSLMRCPKCEAHRKGLHSLLSRMENDSNTYQTVM